ncbi:hypothetical protein GCM10009548_87130 [Streptomyces malaysiensis subsp. malaysiensis]
MKPPGQTFEQEARRARLLGQAFEQKGFTSEQHDCCGRMHRFRWEGGAARTTPATVLLVHPQENRSSRQIPPACLLVWEPVNGRRRRTGIEAPLFTGFGAPIAALSLPGALMAGGHSRTGHSHDGSSMTRRRPGHDDGHRAQERYDPRLPIDLGGVESVTPRQQVRAEDLMS